MATYLLARNSAIGLLFGLLSIYNRHRRCHFMLVVSLFFQFAPYTDPEQVKEIFFFLIRQSGGLKDPKDPAFNLSSCALTLNIVKKSFVSYSNSFSGLSSKFLPFLLTFHLTSSSHSPY